MAMWEVESLAVRSAQLISKSGLSEKSALLRGLQSFIRNYDVNLACLQEFLPPPGSGSGEPAPTELSVLTLARAVVEEAMRVSDLDLVAAWYAMIPNEFFLGSLAGKEPSWNEDLKTVHQCVIESRAYLIENAGQLLTYPPPEAMEDIEDEGGLKEFLQRWYAPVWNLSEEAR